jgi:hypothetical protein
MAGRVLMKGRLRTPILGGAHNIIGIFEANEIVDVANRLSRPTGLGAVALAERICGEADRLEPTRHLRHVLASYQKYYNEIRTHLSLQKDDPGSA